MPDGADYRGLTAVTADGVACQIWSRQAPHTHSRTIANYPGAGLGGHNACRNPDGDTQPWCYTTDPSVRWGYCNVPPPAEFCDAVGSTVEQASGAD